MKFCKDCAHLEFGHICRSPKNGINLITGQLAARFALDMRYTVKPGNYTDDNWCGPEGNNFEQKPPPNKRSAWWKFLIAGGK